MNEIYSPEEDSYLLSEIIKNEVPKLLKKNKNLRFLEIGSGSGIQLETAEKSGVKKENIFSSDINPLAVKHCKNLGFNSLVSDLFKEFEKGGIIYEGRLSEGNHGCPRRGTLVPLKYDLIIFNPPYLPLDSKEPKDSQIITTGGEKGSETINKFLKQAKKYLNKNGEIFLVISSLTKDTNFKDYKKKILIERKIFFEKLSVLELF